MCCKKPKVPKPDPQIAINLAKQAEQGDRLLSLTEEAYADNKERMVGIDALNATATQQAMDIAAKAEGRADESYQFYMDKGRPLIEQAITDATTYDSQGNIDAARGRAMADVQQGFDNAEQQNQRALTRLGVNPSSGRFMALQQSLTAQKAAALAGAGTNAEEARRSGAIGLRQQAGNLVSGMPAQSIAQNGQALAGGAQGAGITAGGMNTNLQVQGAAAAGTSGAAGIYGSAASGGNALYSNQLQATQIKQAASDSKMSGLGSLAGIGLSMLADGGKVSGPGTGTSDDVPAVNTDNGQRIQLSNGEYVLSADTVKAVGTKFLDNLQKKHHAPVRTGGNLRRAA